MRSFLDQPPNLYHVVALDLPGHGAVLSAESELPGCFSLTISAEQASIIAKALVRSGADGPRLFREALLNTDGWARVLLGASLNAANYIDEVQIVPTLRTPLAIVHGAEEQLVNLDYLIGLTIPSLWRGAIQVIPDAGHSSHREQPKRFNALLAEFVADVGA